MTLFSTGHLKNNNPLIICEQELVNNGENETKKINSRSTKKTNRIAN